MHWDDAKCDEMLEKEADRYLKEVLDICPCLANESEERQAAIASFAYNIGINAFKKSSVSKYINRGEYKIAKNYLLMYVNAGGKVLSGLVNRRTLEGDLFYED